MAPHRFPKFWGSDFAQLPESESSIDSILTQLRTLLVADGKVTFHAGGGVVADSHPRAEYREALDKARALRGALAAFPAAPYPSGR